MRAGPASAYTAARRLSRGLRALAGEHSTLVVFLAGAALTVYGIWTASRSAGWIAGGLVLAALALAWERGHE